MQQSLIIRVYRKGSEQQQGITEVIHGTVENVSTARTEAFSNKEELWRLVCNDLEGDKA
jgi:hypothetical protein